MRNASTKHARARLRRLHEKTYVNFKLTVGEWAEALSAAEGRDEAEPVGASGFADFGPRVEEVGSHR
jgi:hypothetical protein